MDLPLTLVRLLAGVSSESHRGSASWIPKIEELPKLLFLAVRQRIHRVHDDGGAEGEAWLARVLAVPGGDRPTIGRGKCLFGLGTLVLSRGDHASVERYVREALILWRRLGDPDEECWSLFVLGFVARRRGN